MLPVHTIGGASVKRAMWPDPTVERHVVHHPLVGVVDSFVGVGRDLLVFQAPPQPFHETMVAPASSPIRANLDAVRFQQARELRTGELAALINLDDLWAAIPDDRLLHGLAAKVRGQRIGKPPRQRSRTSAVSETGLGWE